MPDLPYLRAEIEHMRRQIFRQRGEIRDLERARISTKSAEELLERMLQIFRQRGEIRDLERARISTKSAEELLERMLAKVDGLCADRDRQRKEQQIKYPGTDKVINGPIERRFR